MKPMRYLNWKTFGVFFLVQLFPNIVFPKFIFHEVGSLFPEIFTNYGSPQHPMSGFVFFLSHPLFFSYDWPIMGLAVGWALITTARHVSLRQILFQPLFASLGVIFGYAVEDSTYHLRVLHGRVPSDWAEGLAYHAWDCFWSIVSVIVAFGIGICVALMIFRKLRTRAFSGSQGPCVH
jgi:hypothetical protein